MKINPRIRAGIAAGIAVAAIVLQLIIAVPKRLGTVAPRSANYIELSSAREWDYQLWGNVGMNMGYDVWGDEFSIYICGSTSSYGAGDHDLLLVKWNITDGNQLWNRTWGGTSQDIGYSVWGDGTGNIYTSGDTMSFGAGDWDMMLVKWDEAGNQLWNRTWGGPYYDYSINSIWCNSTSIYLCGDTTSYGAGGHDAVLVKWNKDGNQLWNRTWGGVGDDYGNGIWGDGTGSIYTCGFEGGHMMLVKWDAAGNQVWKRTGGGSAGYHVWGDGMGSIYTCGHKEDFDIDMMLVKWDEDGNQLWNRTWGRSILDVGYDLWGDQTSIYSCGYSNQGLVDGRQDMVLVKWDTAGNRLWNRTWSGAGDDSGRGIWGDETSIYTCGYTESFGSGFYDMVLVCWPQNMTPSYPRNLHANSGIDSIDVVWDSPGDCGDSPITHYIIYRSMNTDYNFTWAANVTTTSYHDLNVLSNTSYYYVITAVNAIGEGLASMAVIGSVAIVPLRPNNPRTFSSGYSIDVVWDVPSSDGGLPITHYIVYRSIDTDHNYVWFANVTTTSIQDSDVHPNINYYYIITAVNVIGEGPASIAVIASLEPLAQPLAFSMPLIVCIVGGIFITLITLGIVWHKKHLKPDNVFTTVHQPTTLPIESPVEIPYTGPQPIRAAPSKVELNTVNSWNPYVTTRSRASLIPKASRAYIDPASINAINQPTAPGPRIDPPAPRWFCERCGIHVRDLGEFTRTCPGCIGTMAKLVSPADPRLKTMIKLDTTTIDCLELINLLFTQKAFSTTGLMYKSKIEDLVKQHGVEIANLDETLDFMERRGIFVKQTAKTIKFHEDVASAPTVEALDAKVFQLLKGSK